MISFDEARAVWGYDPNSGHLVSRRLGRKVGSLDPSNGYWTVFFRGKKYYAHRIAWLLVTGEFPVADLDHINGVRDDNRWVNLREATRSQNHRNSIKHPGKTGVRGVVRNARGKPYSARVVVGRKVIHLGVFDTIEEASAARKAGEGKYFEGFQKTE